MYLLNPHNTINKIQQNNNKNVKLNYYQSTQFHKELYILPLSVLIAILK